MSAVWALSSAVGMAVPVGLFGLERTIRLVAGETAAVRLRESYLGMTFLDTFGMLRVDARWTIYNKLFHVEG